jgi:hypothetical protein
LRSDPDDRASHLVGLGRATKIFLRSLSVAHRGGPGGQGRQQRRHERDGVGRLGAERARIQLGLISNGYLQRLN